VLVPTPPPLESGREAAVAESDSAGRGGTTDTGRAEEFNEVRLGFMRGMTGEEVRCKRWVTR
jgi:hypothetical protein